MVTGQVLCDSVRIGEHALFCAALCVPVVSNTHYPLPIRSYENSVSHATSHSCCTAGQRGWRSKRGCPSRHELAMLVATHPVGCTRGVNEHREVPPSRTVRHFDADGNMHKESAMLLSRVSAGARQLLPISHLESNLSRAIESARQECLALHAEGVRAAQNELLS
eukprot:CAMPEP_0114606784 /NCGR_PEP_ID=MMETSP0168-20121206/1740_1 /TAXON_ID=95228 ORGANISM="Vannella sp., Strain DIVA3 517/6/12" /NCGR_SAMPLE_ID=MMETSP0168 /ASSEMBLY_ACC=CAM_ASM_000044 /LENGTH=164 /DNA_ID=CAMNT_0001817659 /DNA_START=572 /DNA_END=1062 /DNA_ORIENTATION=-